MEYGNRRIRRYTGMIMGQVKVKSATIKGPKDPSVPVSNLVLAALATVTKK